jgi:hypothetical protein
VAGHVASMGYGNSIYRVLVRGPNVRGHGVELGIGGRIKLRCTLGI